MPLYTVNSTVQNVQSVQLEAKCRKQAPLLQSSATIALWTNLGTYSCHNISSLPGDSMKTSEHSRRFIRSMSDKTRHIFSNGHDGPQCIGGSVHLYTSAANTGKVRQSLAKQSGATIASATSTHSLTLPSLAGTETTINFFCNFLKP